LQGVTGYDREEEWTTCVHTAEPYTEPPNDVDIQMAISELKNGKATEHDQILAELIKQGGKELKTVTYALKREKEIVQHEQKYGIVCPIHKKGEPMTCDNYRAVTLLRTTYKILENILYVRSVPYAEEIIGEYQRGF
jgi:hypothetical protein